MHYFSSKKNILFVLIMLLCLASKAQDTLVMRNGKTILSKIIEVTPTEIKFKKLDNIDGPVYTEDKSTISEIRYSNGAKEKIVFTESQKLDTLIMRKGKKIACTINYLNNYLVKISLPNSKYEYQKSPRTIGTVKYANGSVLKFVDGVWLKEDKVDEYRKNNPVKLWGDYINFNLEVGGVFNKAYCNSPVTDEEEQSYHFVSIEEYSNPNSKSIFLRPSFGLNFSFGRAPHFKHIIAINYLQSKGKYNYYYDDTYSKPWFNPKTHSEKVTIETVSHFVNIYSGCRFVFLKRLNIDVCFSLNIPVYATNILNGYATTTYYEQTGQYSAKVIGKNTHVFENEKDHKKNLVVGLSFSPKISYTFNLKDQKLGVYFSRNLDLQKFARLPWWSLGISYYPFKKLQ